MNLQTSRRDFLKTTAAAGVGFWVAGTTRDVLATPPGPNDRLNVAVIGAGGRGGSNLGAVARTENIVALCDVDEQRARNAFNRFPNAQRFTDFRQMFDRMANRIDAVTVSTPDHTHYHASAMAIRLGKHVYCEKPLTHSVWEARQLKILADRHNVKTQMGNQGTSNNTFREAVEVIQSGVLGPVRELHVWTNRPIWPQGIEEPLPEQPVPDHMSWNEWIGPAPMRPYNSNYAPFKWRGWWDFGTGAIGDMACHTMNLPFMGLRLEAPISVSARITDPDGVNNQTAPVGCIVTYEFPARGNLPPVTMHWYERNRPAAELFQGQNPSGSGCLIIGEQLTMYSPSDYGGSYRLLRNGEVQNVDRPDPTLPRVGGNHHGEWLNAIRNNTQAMSNFITYASKLTETALLGNVAIRVGRQFRWDAENLRSPDCEATAQYVRREYRQGWDA